MSLARSFVSPKSEGMPLLLVLCFCDSKLMRTSLIDHESFLSFGVALTFFTLGVVGILGSDDILCCFIVGNSFTWDDWFPVQTQDHAFQDVIDKLLSSVRPSCPV
jgi:NhaP-type Na+/H+ or K+/H+ antiporter